MKNWVKEHPYCFRYHSHRDSDIMMDGYANFFRGTTFILEFVQKGISYTSDWKMRAEFLSV